MELKQLSNRIYYTPHQKEADRPLLGYIQGDKYSLMVDAGTSSNHVQAFYKAVSEKGIDSPFLHGHYSLALGSYFWDACD